MHAEDRDRLKSELAEKEKEIAAKGGRLLRGEEWREYARARSHILSLTHTHTTHTPETISSFLPFCFDHAAGTSDRSTRSATAAFDSSAR